MTEPATALARLRDGDPSDRKPFRLKLDSGLSIEAPSPRRLAEVFVVPLLRERAEIYRQGAGLLKRPQGSADAPAPLPLADLASAIGRKLADLPELKTTDAGRPYRDARALALHGEPATVGAYLANVARAVVTLAPKYRRPAAEVERPPAMTAAERKAAQRARDRAAEISSARWWLEGYLTGWDGDDEAPAPGSRVPAAELYDLAVDAIEETVDEYEGLMPGESWEDIAEEDNLPERPRVPRRRIFYEVADELLGTRRRGAHGSALQYVIPEPPTTTEEEPDVDPVTFELVLDRLTDKLAAQFTEAAATGKPADRPAATGTDGAVVDLATARATRRNA